MTQFTGFLESIFSATLFDFIPFDCLLSNYEFFHSLLGTTLLPIGISAVLLFIVRFNPWKLRRNALTLFFLLTYIVYPSCSTKVLNVWTCATYVVAGDPDFDDDEYEEATYLLVDFSTDCNSFKYTAMQLYAGLMIPIYPIGIPLLYAVLLYRSRFELYPGLENHGFWSMLTPSHPSWTAPEEHQLSPDHPLDFLVSAYKPRAFWFEVTECVRRIALTRWDDA